MFSWVLGIRFLTSSFPLIGKSTLLIFPPSEAWWSSPGPLSCPYSNYTIWAEKTGFSLSSLSIWVFHLLCLLWQMLLKKKSLLWYMTVIEIKPSYGASKEIIISIQFEFVNINSYRSWIKRTIYVTWDLHLIQFHSFEVIGSSSFFLSLDAIYTSCVYDCIGCHISCRMIMLLLFLTVMLQRPTETPQGPKQDLRSFKLIMEYIKALPVSASIVIGVKLTRIR